MSRIIEAARAELEAHKGRSQRDKGVTLYALDILDAIEEAETWRSANGRAPYVFVTRQAFDRAALNGAESWPHYSYTGQPLYSNWDIIERLYPPSARDRMYRKCERGEYDALADQAKALTAAARRAWRAYSRSLPARLDYDELGPWARACLPPDCIDHHGINENGFMHDLYMKDTAEARELVKRLPRGFDEALLSSFISEGARWFDLPFLWNGSETLEV